MKKKLHITERNFINLIKKIVLEQQTPEELAAQYGRDIMPNYATLVQPVSQTKAVPQQMLKYCPNGYYQKVNQGPYFMCSQSDKIKPIQKELKLNPDGKFGIDTLNAVYKMFGTTSLTDNIINDFNSSVGDYKNVSDTLVSPLTTLNTKIIKISKTNYIVKKIYANYEKKWENGEFTIYINVVQSGSAGSKESKFATNCSLLNNNIIKPAGTATKYSFDESSVSNTIKNHFCQIKSNQA